VPLQRCARAGKTRERLREAESSGKGQRSGGGRNVLSMNFWHSSSDTLTFRARRAFATSAALRCPSLSVSNSSKIRSSGSRDEEEGMLLRRSHTWCTTDCQPWCVWEKQNPNKHEVRVKRLFGCHKGCHGEKCRGGTGWKPLSTATPPRSQAQNRNTRTAPANSCIPSIRTLSGCAS
jgi:hypothetical protein